MDFANRGNRPTNAPQAQQSTAQNEYSVTPAFQPPVTAKKSKRQLNFGRLSSIFMLFAGALLLLTVILGLVFTSGNKEENLIQDDRYQAVFLDSQDGQVYFGRLDVYNDDLYRLTDIYYVRVENPIQPQGTEAQQPNISLAKLGNELHGPQDMMYISKDRVLYWENLKDDGQVVTAITNFKANGEQTSTTPSNTSTDESDASGTQPAGTAQENDTPESDETTENPLP